MYRLKPFGLQPVIREKVHPSSELAYESTICSVVPGLRLEPPTRVKFAAFITDANPLLVSSPAFSCWSLSIACPSAPALSNVNWNLGAYVGTEEYCTLITSPTLAYIALPLLGLDVTEKTPTNVKVLGPVSVALIVIPTGSLVEVSLAFTVSRVSEFRLA